MWGQRARPPSGVLEQEAEHWPDQEFRLPVLSALPIEDFPAYTADYRSPDALRVELLSKQLAFICLSNRGRMCFGGILGLKKLTFFF